MLVVLQLAITYKLTIEVANKSGVVPVDITKEILEEGHEHQFFFEFSNNVFSNPLGNGNIDTYNDALVYDDLDSNNLPIGLQTLWTTGSNTLSNGIFKIKLQHLPGLKTANVTAADGDTDIDLSFVLNIQAPN